MNLLIVESPTKARTLKRFLGKDFEVMATAGHLRDLPKSKMGVNLENFEPDYVLDTKKSKIVAELKKQAKKAKKIVLATDPDREGEAIAWHVAWILREKAGISKEKMERVSFHEITKTAVEAAVAKGGEINSYLVDAQQGRRVLDRVVGYKLSPLLWKKVRTGLSAGRVQSVTLRLVCEREKEREAFKKRKYFLANGQFSPQGKTAKFEAGLTKWKGERLEKSETYKLFDGTYKSGFSVWDEKKIADKVMASLGKTAKVEKVQATTRKRSAGPPLTTSRMQQAAARAWGWSGRKTMRAAQNLYEKGLITYHRTDSVYLADEAVEAIRKQIATQFGNEYVAAAPRRFKNRTKLAQEAHEAIRPTKVGKSAAEGTDEGRLYQLIWQRAVASQAREAEFDQTKLILKSGEAEFEARGVKMIFRGFLAITGEKTEDQLLPQVKEGEEVKILKTSVLEQETSPPPRYNEASLIASLEKQGIGRPSTYAPTIATVLGRQYLEREEGRLAPTALGIAVNEFLVSNFSQIVDLPFTASMEEGLDEVARGELKWKELLGDFWKDLEPRLAKVEKNAKRVEVAVEKTGEKCPECKEGEMVIRVGRFGKFKACSRFPDCRHTEPLVEKLDFECPDCGSQVVQRRTRKGRKFFGCSSYPKCKWASWRKPV